jgi:hypothetical protein
MRQAHHEEVDFTFYAANHAKGLTKIYLGVARAMCQRHKHFFGAPLFLPNVIGHRGQAACISMLFAQTLKNTLCCVTLFFDEGFVGAQYLVVS